ncbi:MAG: SUMF1/EgtB/PvdO family nonheme iron enzyme [Treponema sp.]|jgi:hypothetical protein|nr:SUMF1/EgtB/PvdO family nonheme iron enzyme [Treponema sp.]
MREKQPEINDNVKLPHFLGIRPGVYLTVLYSIILLLVFFFLLVFPGLKNPGAVLSVKTEPSGAAVRIDGVYMGTSGKKIAVPKGVRVIEAVLPGFKTERIVQEIPGRIFGSLFFPLKKTLEITLKTDDPVTAFSIAAADFAAWTFGGEPTESWQIPLSLSEGVYRIDAHSSPQTDEILKAVSRFTVTRASLRDLLRAKILLDNSGNSPSPAGLVSSISNILQFLSDNPGSAQWLSNLLPPESASIVRASTWNNTENTVLSAEEGVPINRRFELSGLLFTGIRRNNGKSFLISENPVPYSLFQTFLTENPEWKDEHTDYFNDEISINSQEMYNNDSITGVSWYAACALCRWLSKRLPASMSEMEIRLPTEAEWDAAKTSIKSMEASGWEWCADPYAPLTFISASQWAIEVAGSPERSLRGRPSSSSLDTRASLPPELSSPFVTFRLVIADKP